MNRLIGKKILVLLAIWLLTGGLALADSFDLTDELQLALIDRTCALETDPDEVRESIVDAVASLGLRGPNLAPCGGAFQRLLLAQTSLCWPSCGLCRKFSKHCGFEFTRQLILSRDRRGWCRSP